MDQAITEQGQEVREGIRESTKWERGVLTRGGCYGSTRNHKIGEEAGVARERHSASIDVEDHHSKATSGPQLRAPEGEGPKPSQDWPRLDHRGPWCRNSTDRKVEEAAAH
jgi:hypothetical protein